MSQALRSRCFALATLAAFVLAQPASVCVALCLFEGHDAGVHAMSGMSGRAPTVVTSSCHPTSAGAVQRDPFQVLSPMAPARATVLAVAPARQVEPARTFPAPPRPVSHTAEPPPPRIV